MSALTAALTAALLTTPVVQVTHDRVVEFPRVAEVTIQPSASKSGIEKADLNVFLERVSQRYSGFN